MEGGVHWRTGGQMDLGIFGVCWRPVSGQPVGGISVGCISWIDGVVWIVGYSGHGGYIGRCLEPPTPSQHCYLFCSPQPPTMGNVLAASSPTPSPTMPSPGSGLVSVPPGFTMPPVSGLGPPAQERLEEKGDRLPNPGTFEECHRKCKGESLAPTVHTSPPHTHTSVLTPSRSVTPSAEVGSTAWGNLSTQPGGQVPGGAGYQAGQPRGLIGGMELPTGWRGPWGERMLGWMGSVLTVAVSSPELFPIQMEGVKLTVNKGLSNHFQVRAMPSGEAGFGVEWGEAVAQGERGG